ncbi:MAG: lipopolysaccharide heptosyltransferase I [Deltaproteobacteria bacterium]|nr:lipopolysaccharide heptosyltransferase I [Deltaproteobacteria bacterium]
MRVLVVKMSALGDIIHALPVLDYLHQVMPGIEVDWVVEEPFRDILEGNPLISCLHVVRTKVWRKKPFSAATRREIRAVKNALQARDYDRVFDIQGNLKSGLVDWLTGAENRIGFTQETLQESINTLFTTQQIPVRRQDYHITDQYLRLVSVSFGKDFSSFNLSSGIYTSPEDDEIAGTLISTMSDGLVFLFHYGTTWQTKFWFEEGWVHLGKTLLERYPDSTILLSWGNESERAAVIEIAAGIGNGARVLERFPLKGFTALLKKVDLVVGGDTGPIHIAAAVGTPTVSLYRASDGKRSGPRGACHVIVQSPFACTSCFRTECDKDDKCRRSITVVTMVQAVEKALAG